jgi:hypothetical protein
VEGAALVGAEQQQRQGQHQLGERHGEEGVARPLDRGPFGGSGRGRQVVGGGGHDGGGQVGDGLGRADPQAPMQARQGAGVVLARDAPFEVGVERCVFERGELAVEAGGDRLVG